MLHKTTYMTFAMFVPMPMGVINQAVVLSSLIALFLNFALRVGCCSIRWDCSMEKVNICDSLLRIVGTEGRYTNFIVTILIFLMEHGDPYC